MARKGRYARHTGDFVVLIRQWLNELKRPYEKDKYCVKIDELRDWSFGDSLLRVLFKFVLCFKRKLNDSTKGTHMQHVGIVVFRSMFIVLPD